MTLAEHRGISVVVDKGYQIPDAYLTSLLNTKPNVFGAVSVNIKDNCLDISVHSVPPELKGLKAWNKALEDKRYILFTGNYPEGYLADSVQPFRMLAEDGKALVAATLVGDFKVHHPSGEGNHSDEFYCAHTILMGKVQQFYRICKGDHKMFWDELDSVQSKKEIVGLIGPQGGQISLIFQSDDGLKIRHYQKSIPTFKKFTWGDTSNVLDYVTGIETGPSSQPSVVGTRTEPTIDRVKPETVKPKANKFVIEEDDEEDIQVKPADEPAPAAQPSKPTEPKPIEVIMPNGSIMRQVIVGSMPIVLWFPPMDMTKRRILKKAYKSASKANRDVSNAEIEQRIGVEANEELVKQFREELKRKGVVVGSDAPRYKTPDATAVSQGKNAATGKPVEVVTHTAEERKAEDMKEYGSPIYTILTNKDKYDTNKYLKTLDKNGQSIINPNDDEDENTTEQFYKAIDYPGVEQTFGWRAEWRFNLARVSPRAMAIWSGDLLRVIRNLSKENESLRKDMDEDVVTFTPKRKKA
jgi:hypothetical protein